MLTGVGFTGEPAYIPMLIKQMEKPDLARVSGGAFTLITGVDLYLESLAGEPPEGFDAGPNDDPTDDNVEMDIDEDLPWPNATLVRNWWENNKGSFVMGTRYLAGQAVSPAHCKLILGDGMQSQRYAAALELALSQPDAPWFNTLAPGSRQLRHLQNRS